MSIESMQVAISASRKFEIQNIYLERGVSDPLELFLLSVSYTVDNHNYLMDYNTVIFNIKDLYDALSSLLTYKYLQKNEDTIFGKFSLANSLLFNPQVTIPYNTLTYTNEQELLQFLQTNYPELYY